MKTQQRKLIAAVSLCAAAVVPNIASAASISGKGTWESTLQGRDLDGNLATAEAYYDTDLNITWLANANYATSVYATSALNWSSANGWAASLNPYGSGITGWRLPTTTDTGAPGAQCTHSGTDCGYNVDTASSEMAHMFYVTLGDKAKYDTSGNLNQIDYWNTGPFFDVRSGFYWSATAYAPNTSYAWGFHFTSGYQQNNILKINSWYKWAVHAGDVGVDCTAVVGCLIPPPSVPVPAAAWLFGSGLLGLVGLGRKRRR